MNIIKIACVILSCLWLLGASCGAPTEYQKYKANQKTECEVTCEQAHKDSDKDGKRRCIQVCRVRKEMKELDREEESESEERRQEETY